MQITSSYDVFYQEELRNKNEQLNQSQEDLSSSSDDIQQIINSSPTADNIKTSLETVPPLEQALNLEQSLNSLQIHLRSLKKELKKNPRDIQQIITSHDQPNLKGFIESIQSLDQKAYELHKSIIKIINIANPDRLVNFDQLETVVTANKHLIGAVYLNNAFAVTGCLITPKLFLTTGHYSLGQDSIVKEVRIQFLPDCIRAACLKRSILKTFIHEKNTINEEIDESITTYAAELACLSPSAECDFAIFKLTQTPNHFQEHQEKFVKFDLEAPKQNSVLTHYSETIGLGTSGAPLFTPNGGIYCIHSASSCYGSFQGCRLETILFWLLNGNNIELYQEIRNAHPEIHLILPADLPKFSEEGFLEIYKRAYTPCCDNHSFDGKKGKNNQHKVKSKKKSKITKTETINNAQTLELPTKNLQTLYEEAKTRGLLTNLTHTHRDTIANVMVRSEKDRDSILQACQGIFQIIFPVSNGGNIIPKHENHKALKFPEGFQCLIKGKRMDYLEISDHMDNDKTRKKVNKDAAEVMQQQLDLLLKNNP